MGKEAYAAVERRAGSSYAPPSAAEEKSKNGPCACFAARAKKQKKNSSVTPADVFPSRTLRQPRTSSRVPSARARNAISRPSQLGWRQSSAVARRTRSRRRTPRDPAGDDDASRAHVRCRATAERVEARPRRRLTRSSERPRRCRESAARGPLFHDTARLPARGDVRGLGRMAREATAPEGKRRETQPRVHVDVPAHRERRRGGRRGFLVSPLFWGCARDERSSAVFRERKTKASHPGRSRRDASQTAHCLGPSRARVRAGR